MDIVITKSDEVFLKINCEEGLAYELYDYFSFFVPGFQYMPLFKQKLWDGKVRLFSARTHLLYYGLLTHLIQFCTERKYKFHVDSSVHIKTPWTIADTERFAASLNIPLSLRQYQIDSITEAIVHRRRLIVSPTGSGKSLVIYILLRYFMSLSTKKILLLVPTVNLVEQLFTDFASYGWNEVEQHVHRQYAGKEKQSDKSIILTTWQNVYQLPATFFQQFNVVMGDEFHLFKSKSLQKIMTSCTRADYRIGITGTLDGSKTHRLILEGTVGPVYEATTTKTLIEHKALAELKIKCLVLKYPEPIRKEVRSLKLNYAEEMNFIVGYQARNQFIANLAASLQGNVLILFQFIDKHGQVLYNLLEKKVAKLHYIHGGIEAEEREEIRKIITNGTQEIVLGSYGTYSIGVNIPNLNHVIFASPSKARIRVLQSIGRGLRRTETKDTIYLYDICDDLRVGKYENFMFQHFIERLTIYHLEGFPYAKYSVNIK